MTISICFYTQGCRLNQAETATLEREFEAKGFGLETAHDKADIVVVNTCTVTEHGDADTRKLVNRINRENPAAKIALIGCQAQILKDQLLALPNVNWVIGNAQKMNLLDILSVPREEPQLLVEKITRESFTIETPAIDTKHRRANLKIQDGCDFYCAFCVIPFARGPARSREFNDILREAKLLVEAGHQELILTGINIGTYAFEDKTLMDVITALEAIEGLARIRISSIEPTTIPEALIQHMASSEKLCSYVHIPLQAATDEILKGMNRKYALKEFDDFIHFVRKTVPDVCIGTDVIVGFPGETQHLFEQAESYLRDAPIDYFHVFSYSERKFARSKKMPDQVSTQDKALRSKALRTLSNRKKMLFLKQFEGRELDVLFEQEKKGEWIGTTANYIKVHVPTSSSLENQRRHVTLLHAENGHIKGKL